MAEVSELEKIEQNSANTNTADMDMEESEASATTDGGESDADVSMLDDGSTPVATEETDVDASSAEESLPEEPIASPPVQPVVAATVEEPDPEPKQEKIIGEYPTTNLNRREFLTYAWGLATTVLLAESGVATYQFMYPRFKAGEFGGDFLVPESELPVFGAEPKGEPAGKYWLVNREVEGPKAIYMVCTHLGCLYKWEPSTNRFECPCHGSKFDREGFYIEGPAPRSLDYFDVEMVDGQLVIHTGKKIIGDPAGDSPAKAVTS